MTRKMVVVFVAGLLLGGFKAGADIMDSLGGLIGHGVLKLAEVGVTQGVVELNNYTQDPYTGALLYILPYHHFRELHAQAEETQSMVTDLQNQVAGLRTDIDSQLQELQAGVDRQAYSDAIQPLLHDASALDTLDTLYAPVMAIVTNCITYQVVLTNGVWVTNQVFRNDLTAVEMVTVNNLVTNPALASLPNTVLQDIETAVCNDPNVFALYAKVLADAVPFQHQTYTNMYGLYNFVAGLGTRALNYQKEYLAYQFGLQTNVTDFASYLAAKSYPAFMTNFQTNLVYAITNNHVLTEMAIQLPESCTNVYTNMNQRINYLLGLTQTNCALVAGGVVTQAVYRVINNADNCIYLITEEPQPLQVACELIRANVYSYWLADQDARSLDGRFSLAENATSLQALFGPCGYNKNPMDFLRRSGGLTGISTSADGIRLNQVQSCGSPQEDEYLFLLDAISFDPALVSTTAGPYMGLGGVGTSPKIRASDVDNKKSAKFGNQPAKRLVDAKFLRIYRDTHIGGAARAVYWKPASTDMAGILSLADGDVLDLSDLSCDLSQVEVRVCGQATIIGGGSIDSRVIG